MEHKETENKTAVTTFILLGFGNDPELQIPLFLVFLIIYAVTMAGNIIIVVLIITDRHLHIPMYFFLGNFSCVETLYTSTLLPRMLASFLTGDRTISVGGCLFQFYCFGTLVIVECYLLASMSYDRYLAICKPLRYATVMSKRLCFLLAAISWLCGISLITLVVSLMSQLNYCGPCEIDHFYCDLTPVLNLSCSDTSLVTLVGFTVSVIDTIPCLLTLLSYVYIIAAVIQIPSSDGRKKAFSTCSSHLIVVSTFYGSLIFVYILPKEEVLTEVEKISSVFYTVLTPLINPLIYSLRNKEVKKAFMRAVKKCVIYE